MLNILKYLDLMHIKKLGHVINLRMKIIKVFIYALEDEQIIATTNM